MTAEVKTKKSEMPDSPEELKEQIEGDIAEKFKLGSKGITNRALRRRKTELPGANKYTKKQPTRAEIKKRRKKGRK